MNRVRLGIYSSINVILQSCYQVGAVFVLGLGRSSDIYFAAATVGGFLVALVYAVSTFAVMPAVVQLSEAEMYDRTRLLLGYGSIFLLPPFIAVALFVSSCGDWLYPNFVPEFAATYNQVMFCELFSAYFGCVAVVLSVREQVGEGFGKIERCTLISNLIGLFLLVAIYAIDGSVTMIAASDILRNFILVVILLAVTRCLPRFENKGIAKIRPLFVGASALMAGNLFAKSMPLLDRVLASHGAPGEVAILHIIQQVSAAGQRFLSRLVSVPGLVILTKQAGGDKRLQIYRGKLRAALVLSIIFYLAIFGGALLVQHWFSQFFVEGWQFDLIMIVIYAAAALIIAGPCGQISASFFYSMGNTRTPMRIGSLGVVLGFVVKLALYHRFGVVGLLIGLGVHQLFNFVCLDRLVYSSKY